MEFVKRRAALAHGYQASNHTITIDLNQLELVELADFLMLTTGSSNLQILLDDAFLDDAIVIQCTGRTTIWEQTNLPIQFILHEDASIEITFHLLPQQLTIPFPDLNTIIYQALPLQANTRAQLIYNSDEQVSENVLAFHVKFPLDKTSADWNFLVPILDLQMGSALTQGTLKRKVNGIDFHLPISPEKSIQLNEKTSLNLSAAVSIQTQNMDALRAHFEARDAASNLNEDNEWESDQDTDDDEFIDEEADQDMDEDEDLYAYVTTDDDSQNALPDFQNDAHIVLSARLNDEFALQALLRSLQPDLIVLETVGDLQLTNFNTISWLPDGIEVRNFIPENFREGLQIKLKHIQLTVNVEELELLSAQLSVEISGHKPISFFSDHLKLETCTLQIFIDDPFNDIKFFATTRVELEFANARFMLIAALPQLDFSLRLLPGSTIEFDQLTDLFPVRLPKIDSVRVSKLAIRSGLSENASTSFSTTLESTWNIPIGKSSLAIESLNIVYLNERNTSFGEMVGMARLFDFPLVVSAFTSSDDNGYRFLGRIPQYETIHIKSVVEKLGALFNFTAPSNIPDIALTALQVEFATSTKDFKLSAKATLNEKIGPIDKGEFALEIGLTTSAGTNTHEFQVLLSGDLDIEQTNIAFQADLGHANWSIQFDWKKAEGDAIQLLQLVRLVAPHADLSRIPQEATDALSIAAASMHYQHQAKTISIALDSDGGEHAVFIAHFANEQFEFLFGMGYQNPNDVPANMGLHLHAIHENVHLEKLWFLINTITDDTTAPALPKVFPHEIKPTSLGSFIGVLATIDLHGAHTGTGLNHIANHLGTTELVLVGTASEKNGHTGVTLRAELNGAIRIPVGHHEEKHNNQTVRVDDYLQLENCFIKFAYHDSHVELALGGTMHFTIDHVAVSPTLELLISNEGLTAEANLLFDNGFQHGLQLFGMDGFYLDQIGLLLGLEFAGPSIQIGLDGAMTFHENHFMFGIVLAFVGDIPNLEYFALSIDEIDFSKLIATFIGNAATGNQSLKELKGENLSIYWAEKAITLPSGTETRPGFGLHGELDIFGWKAYCDIDIHADSGARGHAEAAKIDWGKFKLYGNGTGVFVNKYQDESGQWKRIRNSDRKPLSDYPNHQSVMLVPPGGPVIHFDSTNSPFISASVHVEFLKMMQADLDLKVASEGIDFNLHWNIEHITNFRLQCSMQDWKEVKANGNFFAGIQLPPLETVFGPIDVELGVYGNLDIFINEKPTDLKLTVHGGLDFLGAEIPFVVVDIRNFPDDANEMPMWLAKTFAESVFPPLHKFFEAAYDELYGHSNAFDQQKREHALYILDSINNWIAFIDADLAEIEKAKHNSYGSARQTALKIRREAAEIRAHHRALTQNMMASGNAERERLTQLHTNIKQAVTTKRTTSFNRNRNLIANQQREMRELLDQNRAIRNAIEALWNAHQQELNAIENVHEKNQHVARISQQIDAQLPTLMLPISTPEKTKANAHQFTSDGHYNHHTNVDARFQAYPNIPGKYTPVAVQHHAKMIAIQRIADAQEQAMLWEAHQQAAQIIQRAEQAIHTSSL